LTKQYTTICDWLEFSEIHNRWVLILNKLLNKEGLIGHLKIFNNNLSDDLILYFTFDLLYIESMEWYW